MTGIMPSSTWSINFNNDLYKAKIQEMNNYFIPYTSVSYVSSGPETISEPRILQLPAYGLRHDEIKIKEIDGVLTVKSEPVDKTKYTATINKIYTLKNVIVQNKTLVAGVLSVEFVDSDNVVRHTINEGIDY
jgi:hypothetical protein